MPTTLEGDVKTPEQVAQPVLPELGDVPVVQINSAQAGAALEGERPPLRDRPIEDLLASLDEEEKRQIRESETYKRSLSEVLMVIGDTPENRQRMEPLVMGKVYKEKNKLPTQPQQQEARPASENQMTAVEAIDNHFEAVLPQIYEMSHEDGFIKYLKTQGGETRLKEAEALMQQKLVEFNALGTQKGKGIKEARAQAEEAFKQTKEAYEQALAKHVRGYLSKTPDNKLTDPEREIKKRIIEIGEQQSGANKQKEEVIKSEVQDVASLLKLLESSPILQTNEFKSILEKVKGNTIKRIFTGGMTKYQILAAQKARTPEEETVMRELDETVKLRALDLYFLDPENVRNYISDPVYIEWKKLKGKNGDLFTKAKQETKDMISKKKKQGLMTLIQNSADYNGDPFLWFAGFLRGDDKAKQIWADRAPLSPAVKLSIGIGLFGQGIFAIAAPILITLYMRQQNINQSKVDAQREINDKIEANRVEVEKRAKEAGQPDAKPGDDAKDEEEKVTPVVKAAPAAGNIASSADTSSTPEISDISDPDQEENEEGQDASSTFAKTANPTGA